MKSLNSMMKQALKLQKSIAEKEQEIQQCVAPLKAELAELVAEMDPLFGAEHGDKGSVLTAQGKVSRKVTNSYSFADGAVDVLSTIVGEDLIKYVAIDTKTSYKPTAAARSLASDGDAAHTELGNAMRRILLVETKENYKFEPVL
jgi:hypothetical protein